VRRVDGLELDAVDADAPAAGLLVEDPAQLGVDLVAGGQGLLEVERADDVAQGGDGQLLDALDEVGDLVDGVLRLGAPCSR
jgi:glycogen operon protein